MTIDTEGFRRAHQELHEQTAELRLAAEGIPTLSTYERAQTRARVLSFLRERVEPHTRLDELVLFPEVVSRLGDPLVTASMNYDHLAIRHWIELIAAADVTDGDSPPGADLRARRAASSAHVEGERALPGGTRIVVLAGARRCGKPARVASACADVRARRRVENLVVAKASEEKP